MVTGRKFVPVFFFLFLTVVSTWPLLGSIQTHLPLGMENAATVPLFNLWSVWWNADRAFAGYKGYWDAPIFYPNEKSFAFSEPMPLSVLAAPVIWITDNRVLAYNCLLFFFLWFNGMTAFVLLRRLGYGRPPALIGGAMMVMLPLVHSFLGVLQLVPVFGILCALLALYRLGRSPTLAGGLLIGAALAVTYFLCVYYGAFLSILILVCGGLLLWRQALCPKIYFALISGMLLCGVICLPVIRVQQQVVKAHQRTFSIEYLIQLSADPESYRVSPWPGLFDGGRSEANTEMVGFKLAPGKVRAALMLLGIVWGIFRRKRRDWILFCTALVGVAFLLSLGPHLRLLGCRPYLFLIHWVPGWAQIRNIFRFAVFVHLGVTLLAVEGVEAVSIFVCRYFPQGKWRRYAAVVPVIVAGLAILEVWPAAQPLYAVPPVEKNFGWTRYLRTHTPSDSVVICVPFPFKPDVSSYQQEAQWLYWGTFHRRRMVNGYSGIFPQSFLNLKWPMTEFPTPKVISRLGELGVDYCVVRQDTFFGEEMQHYVHHDPRLEMVYHDGRARIDIYRLTMEPHFSEVSDTNDSS